MIADLAAYQPKRTEIWLFAGLLGVGLVRFALIWFDSPLGKLEAGVERSAKVGQRDRRDPPHWLVMKPQDSAGELTTTPLSAGGGAKSW